MKFSYFKIRNEKNPSISSRETPCTHITENVVLGPRSTNKSKGVKEKIVTCKEIYGYTV